jgi:hypothetical protein
MASEQKPEVIYYNFAVLRLGLLQDGLSGRRLSRE